MCAAAAGAQGFNRVVGKPDFSGAGLPKGLEFDKTVKRPGAEPRRKRAATRSSAEAPQGEAKKFIAVDYEPAYGFYDEEGYSYLFPRLREMSLIFADGGKVYVPNMFLTSMLGDDDYLEGETDEAGNIVIKSGQLIDTYTYYDGTTADFIFGKVDIDTYEMMDEPVTLYYHAESGSYYTPEDEFVGAFFVEKGESDCKLHQYCTDLCYDALSYLQGPVKYDYYYDESIPDADNVGMKTEVDGYWSNGSLITTCLLPVYVDAMFAFEPTEDGSQRFNSIFLADDDLLASVAEGDYLLDYADFVHDPADGSYTLPSNYSIVGLFVMEDETTGELLYYANSTYSNVSLVPSDPAGIGGVETAGKGAAVAVEYYDLSGRRVSAAAQGISIRVEKYADGTSKALKVVK